MVLELLAEKDIQVTWNSASVLLDFVRFEFFSCLRFPAMLLRQSVVTLVRQTHTFDCIKHWNLYVMLVIKI